MDINSFRAAQTVSNAFLYKCKLRRLKSTKAINSYVLVVCARACVWGWRSEWSLTYSIINRLCYLSLSLLASVCPIRSVHQYYVLSNLVCCRRLQDCFHYLHTFSSIPCFASVCTRPLSSGLNWRARCLHTTLSYFLWLRLLWSLLTWPDLRVSQEVERCIFISEGGLFMFCSW